MTYAGLVNEYTKALNEVLLQIDGREIEPIVMKLNETMRNGNHIYVFGNRGYRRYIIVQRRDAIILIFL